MKEGKQRTSAQRQRKNTPLSLEDDAQGNNPHLNGILIYPGNNEEFELKRVLKGNTTGIGDMTAGIQLSQSSAEAKNYDDKERSGEVIEIVVEKQRIPRRLSQHKTSRAQKMLRDFLERARLIHYEAALIELGYREVRDLIKDFGSRTCPPESLATLAALGFSPVERNRLIAYARKMSTDRPQSNATKHQGKHSMLMKRTLSIDNPATLSHASSRSRGKSVSFEALSEEPQRPPFNRKSPGGDGVVIKESTRSNVRLRHDLPSFDGFAENFEDGIVGEWNGNFRSIGSGSADIGNSSIGSIRGTRLRSPAGAGSGIKKSFATHSTGNEADSWVKRPMYSTEPPQSPRLATQAAAYLGPRASPSTRTHSPASPHHKRSPGPSGSPKPSSRPTPRPAPRRSAEPEPENPFVLPFTLEFSSAPLGGFLEGIGFSSPTQEGGSQI